MKKRTLFPEKLAQERIKNFEEVTLPLDYELVKQEAERCLQCKNALCITGCPVGLKIPQFILAVREGDIEKAYQIIREDHFLPAVCGRVCPQEKQCEKVCVLAKTKEPIAIGKIERFIGDEALKNNFTISSQEKKIHKKVAVIGSGPAGLSFAGEMARCGIKVRVFEALHKIGGVLVYGIPEFRLPKSIIKKEIEQLQKMGVEFVLNTVIGKTIDFEDLRREYDVVFIGVGAGTPHFLNIPGEKLNGVFSANEFLTRINLMNAYSFLEYDTPILPAKHVVVVGGGNTAMDAARTAIRLGAKKVSIVYRRSEEELPARYEEYLHAKEEGVSFNFLLNPIELIGDHNGRVKEIILQKMTLGEKDAKGKRKPIVLEGVIEKIEADMVIIAIGTEANPLVSFFSKDLKTNTKGYILVDEYGQTSLPNVYAGGDIVTGAATVIEALGSGKKSAQYIINQWFKGESYE